MKCKKTVSFPNYALKPVITSPASLCLWSQMACHSFYVMRWPSWRQG